MAGSGGKSARRRVAGATAQWICAAAVVLVIWQWILAPHLSSVFFAQPLPVLHQLQSWAADGTLWEAVRATLSEALAGLALGVGIGVVLALMIGFLPRIVGAVLEPVVVVVYASPKFVIAPILFLWAGTGFVPRAVIVVLGVFPLIAVYTLSGIRTVDREVVSIMRLYGATTGQVSRKLLLPHSVGYLLTGITLAGPFALTLAMGAEILFGSTDGIGGALNTGSDLFSATQVLAAIVLGTAASAAVMLVSRLIVKWLTPNTGVVSPAGRSVL